MCIDGNMCEKPRLKDFLQKRADNDPNKLVINVIVDVLKFMNKADQSDDITVMSTSFNG